MVEIVEEKTPIASYVWGVIVVNSGGRGFARIGDSVGEEEAVEGEELKLIVYKLI